MKNNLLKLRTGRGLTLQKLAELSGVSVQRLHSLQLKDRGGPTLQSARKIAAALGVSVDDVWPESQSTINQQKEG